MVQPRPRSVRGVEQDERRTTSDSTRDRATGRFLTVHSQCSRTIEDYWWDRRLTCQAPAAIFAHAPVASSTPQIDCDAAMLSIRLVAHAHGIGTCWNGLLQRAAVGDHLWRFTKLAEFLAIPEGHKCYAAATVGYPAVRLHSRPPREVAITWIGA